MNVAGPPYAPKPRESAGSGPWRAASRTLVNFLILFLSLAGGLLASEGFLYLMGLPREHRPHSHPPQFAPVPGSDFLYVNLPSAHIRFQYDSDPRLYFGPGRTVDHSTNSFGFRGAEFTRAKPPGTIRILFLGDSFTFGEGVHDQATLPERGQ